MKKILPAIAALILASACSGPAGMYGRLNRQASEEYLEPVRPASEGRNPCWNKFAKKFMYAPAFDVPVTEGAARYRFTVKGEDGQWSFESTGQFEDVNVKGLEPYQNLTNCTAAPYASYLLTKPSVSDRDRAEARDLVRLSEDQFVHWAYHDLTQDGFPKKNAPCVHEQYKYEMPVDNSACNVANAWLDIYEDSGDLLCLAKAKALIDNITIQQNAVNGQIPTTWEWRETGKDRKRTYWVNCTFSSVSILMRFAAMQDDIDKLNQ